MGQSLYSLFRPAYENAPELAGLASQALAEPETSDRLRRQIDFDDKIARELSVLRLSDSQAAEFASLLFPDANTESRSGQPRRRESVKATRRSISDASKDHSKIEQNEDQEEEEQPARRPHPRGILFAVGVGLVATVCMVIFLISDRLNSFEGADRIGELLDVANNLTGDEFEAVETRAGDLQDWFFLKHGLEHYAVPKQFANIKTVGCRVFKFDGATVAQIMAVTDKELLLYMFAASELGIKIRKGKWEIVEDNKWVGGLTGVNDTCFLVAFKGTRDDMKEFLSRVNR
jgi:hypothetical protein